MNKKLTDNDIKKALEEWIKNYDGLCENFITLENALNYFNRLEAEKKELQELVDDMSDYFPACIDCEGKTEDGVRTDKCVFLIDKTNYCVKRGISNIVAIRKENAELKAENERLKELLDSSQERYAEAYKECSEEIKSYYKETRFAYEADNIIEDIEDLLKEKLNYVR